MNTRIERALLDAFSDDLAELASACSQLLQDSADSISEQIVERYYGGRVETNAFKVADAALAGRSGEAPPDCLRRCGPAAFRQYQLDAEYRRTYQLR